MNIICGTTGFSCCFLILSEFSAVLCLRLCFFGRICVVVSVLVTIHSVYISHETYSHLHICHLKGIESLCDDLELLLGSFNTDSLQTALLEKLL